MNFGKIYGTSFFTELNPVATSEDIMYNFFVSNQALRFGPTFMQYSTVATQIQLNLIGVCIIPWFYFHFNQ